VPAVLDRALNRPEKAVTTPRASDMKTFTVSIDSRLDRTLDELKESLGKTSRADVFRLAVTLLKLAEEARSEGLKLTLSKQGKIEREIVLPG
jgi:metal-responsive CopG/Arc/MetJ family transcriptional regulator